MIAFFLLFHRETELGHALQLLIRLLSESNVQEEMRPSINPHHHQHELKYEVCISRTNSHCVRLRGPYIGSRADIDIFRISPHPLLPHETILGDLAYEGEPVQLMVPYLNPITDRDHEFNALVNHERVLVENFFGRIKCLFECLHGTWRHSRLIHGKVVRVLVNLVNIMLRRAPLRADHRERIPDDLPEEEAEIPGDEELDADEYDADWLPEDPALGDGEPLAFEG